jgi:hypothetical protein
VRLLLDHPGGKTIINRNEDGHTALKWACYKGCGEIARLLLASGADPTIADDQGNTPWFMPWGSTMRAAGSAWRRSRSAAAAVCTCCRFLTVSPDAWGAVFCMPQEAERAYLLWKARQVADAAASFAAPPVVEETTRDEGKRRRAEAVPEEPRGHAAPGEGEGLAGVSINVAGGTKGREAKRTRAALLEHAVHFLKPEVFEELMEIMG